MPPQVQPPIQTPTIDSPPTVQPQEVSWQICFWILTTLALNSLSQPGGRTIGMPSRYFYVRSSPVVCMVDSFLIPFRILYMSLRMRISARNSVTLFLAHRFRRCTNETSPRAASKTIWLRWLLFILGPFVQLIRLTSLIGVPYTKMFGYAFAINWVMMEGILYVGSRLQSSDPKLSDTFGRYYRLTHEEIYITAENEMSIIETCIGFLAVLCFYCFLLGALIGTTIPPDPMEWAVKLGFLGDFLYPLFSSFLMIVGFVVFLIVYIAISWMAHEYPWICRSLSLGVPRDEMIRGGGLVDPFAVGALLFAFFNLLFALVMYWLVFDPEGTRNPGWTAVFG